MPKISAATVAEHRAQQRDALLDAARGLLLDGGYTALTFTALAERTSLARPTLYSYFASMDDVVVALCEAELPLVAAQATRAMQQAKGPREGIAAFIRTQVQAAQRQPQRLAHTLVNAPLPDHVRARIVALHREVVPSAAPLLEQLGHPDPHLGAVLLQGLINAAVTAIDAGRPARQVTKLTIDAALAGLAGNAAAHPAAGGDEADVPGHDRRSTG